MHAGRLRGLLAALVLVALGLGSTSGLAARRVHRPPRPSPCRASRMVVTPEQFGARGDGHTDDTPALVMALRRVPAGGSVCLSGGAVYPHSDVLQVTVRGTVLEGTGTIVGTQAAASGLEVKADDVVVRDIGIRVRATRRYTDIPQMALSIDHVSRTRIEGVNLNGSAAAGIYVNSSSNFSIINCNVVNTRADGVFMTNGSHHGLVRGVHVSQSGDDGIAVVSYRADSKPVHDVLVEDSSLLGQTWGRGMTVVGGESITYRNVSIISSAGAAIYVASESPPNNTQGVSGVTFEDVSIVDANEDEKIPQGAVLVFAGNSHAGVQNVSFKAVHVMSSSVFAGRILGAVCDGSTIKNVSLSTVAVDSSVLRSGVGKIFTNCA